MKTDFELVQGLINKDQNALKEVIDGYGHVLKVIANNVLAQQQTLSEDVLQNSFLKIWDNIDKYDSEKSTLYTWMARITRNTAIDMRRSKSYLNTQKTDSIDSIVYMPESDNSPTHSIDVKSLLSGIDEKYAFVLRKLYLEGHSHSSLAEEYDIPIGTIKTRLKKGLDILRSSLDKEKGFFLGALLIIILLILTQIS